MLYTRTIREFQLPREYRRMFAQQQFSSRRHNLEYGFESMQQPQWNHCWQQNGYACPQTDILELDENYLLQIALPGVVLDDVELKVEENTLIVVAKRTLSMFEERAAVLRKELPAGYYVREFSFDNEIIHEQIEARMDRGILFVSVPKVEAALRIPVSAGSIESHLPGTNTRVKSQTIRGKEVTIK